MKKQVVFLLVFTLICESWSIPKPMESVDNYNILMVHGAYGASKGFGNKDFVESRLKKNLPETIDALPDWSLSKTLYILDTIPRIADSYVFPEANADSNFLGEANIGYYGSHERLTYWLNKKIFEDDSSSKPQTSYTYHWRSFSNPANSSSNKAHELGDRKWNQGNLSFGNGGFGHRRTLMEEAQEVKAVYDTLHGQTALEIIRQNPDLYRQLASRYILIGHSMGGVVSREYVQGNFYNGDVDKIITLDSPHEGTGALNMLIKKCMCEEFALRLTMESLHKITCVAEAVE
jgi:hypothetical protein